MDVVANYAAGEEAVGAFSAVKEGKANSPSMRTRAPVEGPRRTRRRRKPDHSSGKTSMTTSSPPWNAKGLEALRRRASSIRC